MSAVADPERVARELGGASKAGNGWSCRCPAHDDAKASLNVAVVNEKLLVHCYAGCEQTAVLAALRARGLVNGYDSAAFDFSITALGKPVHVWTYRDAAGTELLKVARYATPTGKEFRPWIPHGARWKCGAHPAPRPLYGLELLAKHRSMPVLVTEGEKACDAARELVGDRYIVTTWPGGANAADKADWSPLRGRAVTLWPDADAPGAHAMRKAAARLGDIAASVALVVDPGDRPKGWDLADAKAEDWTADDVLTLIDEHSRPMVHESATAVAPPFDETERKQTARFKFLTVAELLAEPPIQWRVVRVIPARGLIVLWGVSGTGKSFVAIDLVCAVVRGLPWVGCRTRRGNVLYIATEGRLQHRIAAYLLDNSIDAGELAGLHVLPTGVSLLDAYQVADLIEELRSLVASIDGVALIVIDTLNRALPGGDENSSEDMGCAIAAAKAIEEALGCAVLLVHHGGKDQTRGPRGHSSLKAAVDAELVVERDGDVRTVKIEKSRDGADGETLLTFQLRVVDLGAAIDIDPEAEPHERITSCVVESTTAATPVKSPRIPKGTDIALRALRETVSQYGERMPGTSAIPPGVKATTMGRWRDRYQLLDPIDDSDPAQRGKEVDARKKRFLRARTGLQEATVIGILGDIVWIQ